MSVAEWLRLLRGTKKQQDMADAIGIDRTHLSHLERGARLVTDEVAKQIARGYGLDEAEVMERVEHERRRLRVSPAQLASFAALLERLDQLLTHQERLLDRLDVAQGDDRPEPSAQ